MEKNEINLSLAIMLRMNIKKKMMKIIIPEAIILLTIVLYRKVRIPAQLKPDDRKPGYGAGVVFFDAILFRLISYKKKAN